MPSTTISEEGLATISAISEQLQTGLDLDAIEAITTLIVNGGVHPDAVSALILELRRGVNSNRTKK